MTSSFGDFDSHLSLHDQSQPGWDFVELLAQLGPSTFSGHTEHALIVGTPGTDAQDWVHQTTDFTCDVVSQEMILHEFGVNVSEAQLVYDAASHGWLTEQGTSLENMSRLLELHGVHTHTVLNGSVDALVAELAQGHKVIAAVDSGEMWKTDLPWEDFFKSHDADHAIVITGLDMRDAAHPKVYINDPGDPAGAGKAYPLDEFLNTWADGGSKGVPGMGG